ncbi:MAG: UDP-3-O-(3-hydroxymyristoyl)glucosamine N-acyltransferase [Candidatus Marinimicrobia bacterium]|nr:UDP-3-O-(3-hydroxymyristoyl)glucosamine N-acyltransferase [Candidatus Neomarinimicrobiota bacterium]
MGGEVDGDGTIEITHVCDLKEGTAAGIAFLADPRFAHYLSECRASALILDSQTDRKGHAAIRVAKPQVAFTMAVEMLHPAKLPGPGIHPTAVISATAIVGAQVHVGPLVSIEDGAQVGDGAIIGAGSRVGKNVRLGRKTHLHPNVVLYPETEIGDETIIHSGTVIGTDGFGYVTSEHPPRKIPHLGKVIIGKQVEIGANSCIDRGTIGDTVIGDGTKIDNLVQISHNVQIGQGCLVSGESGIAGSSVVGDNVILAAQVGVADHVTIGDGAIVAGKAGVRQSLEGGKVYAGDPAVERTAWIRAVTAIRKLPQLIHRIRRLENRLEELGQIRQGD